MYSTTVFIRGSRTETACEQYSRDDHEVVFAYLSILMGTVFCSVLFIVWIFHKLFRIQKRHKHRTAWLLSHPKSLYLLFATGTIILLLQTPAHPLQHLWIQAIFPDRSSEVLYLTCQMWVIGPIVCVASCVFAACLLYRYYIQILAFANVSPAVIRMKSCLSKLHKYRFYIFAVYTLVLACILVITLVILPEIYEGNFKRLHEIRSFRNTSLFVLGILPLGLLFTLYAMSRSLRDTIATSAKSTFRQLLVHGIHLELKAMRLFFCILCVIIGINSAVQHWWVHTCLYRDAMNAVLIAVLMAVAMIIPLYHLEKRLAIEEPSLSAEEASAVLGEEVVNSSSATCNDSATTEMSSQWSEWPTTLPSQPLKQQREKPIISRHSVTFFEKVSVNPMDSCSTCEHEFEETVTCSDGPPSLLPSPKPLGIKFNNDLSLEIELMDRTESDTFMQIISSILEG